MSLDIVAILSGQLSLLGKAASSLPVAAEFGATTEIDYNTQLPIDQTPDAISKELQKLDSAGELSFTWKRKKAA